MGSNPVGDAIPSRAFRRVASEIVRLLSVFPQSPTIFRASPTLSLPNAHDLLSPTGRTVGCEPLRDDKSFIHGGGLEWLRLWQLYSREARAILLAAIALGVGRTTISSIDAALVTSGWMATDMKAADAGAQSLDSVSWVEVSEAANRWLALGDVRPRLLPRDNSTTGLTILYGGGGWADSRPECRLFGALAIQIMQSVSGDVLPGHCSYCGCIFELTGRSRKYCRKCGPAARSRLAARRYDAKERARKHAKELGSP